MLVITIYTCVYPIFFCKNNYELSPFLTSAAKIGKIFPHELKNIYVLES